MNLDETKHAKFLNLRDLASDNGQAMPTQALTNKELTPSPENFTQSEPTSSPATIPLAGLVKSAKAVAPENAPPFLGAAAPDAPDCGHHECVNGHQWSYSIAHAGCPKCRRGIFGIGFSNCPICNEPPAKTLIRVDFSSDRIGFTARCANEHNQAETHYITIERAEATPLPAPEAINDKALEIAPCQAEAGASVEGL